jgi:hypothetical protein
VKLKKRGRMTSYSLKPKPSKLTSLAKKYFELDYSDKNVL